MNETAVNGFTLILLVMLGAFAVSACIFATALLKWIRVRKKRKELEALLRERYAPPRNHKVGR